MGLATGVIPTPTTGEAAGEAAAGWETAGVPANGEFSPPRRRCSPAAPTTARRPRPWPKATAPRREDENKEEEEEEEEEVAVGEEEEMKADG